MRWTGIEPVQNGLTRLVLTELNYHRISQPSIDGYQRILLRIREWKLAEDAGFKPAKPGGLPDYKSGAIILSANLPFSRTLKNTL